MSMKTDANNWLELLYILQSDNITLEHIRVDEHTGLRVKRNKDGSLSVKLVNWEL